MAETTERLIQEYGDQAYWKAVEFSMIVVSFGDRPGLHLFSGAAQELLQMGYHKRGRDIMKEVVEKRAVDIELNGCEEHHDLLFSELCERGKIQAAGLAN